MTGRRRSTLRVVALLAGLLVLLVACASAPPRSDTPPPVPPAMVSWPADLPAADAVRCPPAAVEVDTSDQLHTALRDAAPGTVIGLADGVYDGTFTASTPGTTDAPIWLCGGTGAVLRGPGPDDGTVLHLTEVRYWRLVGFTVREGQKGVMADGTADTVIQDLTVTEIGDEAVHLRANSTHNVVRGLTVSDTGLRRVKFGEGIYVGSAVSNWCDITDCEPDRSDRNVVVGNTISRTTAESVVASAITPFWPFSTPKPWSTQCATPSRWTTYPSSVSPPSSTLAVVPQRVMGSSGSPSAAMTKFPV